MGRSRRGQCLAVKFAGLKEKVLDGKDLQVLPDSNSDQVIDCHHSYRQEEEIFDRFALAGELEVLHSGHGKVAEYFLEAKDRFAAVDCLLEHSPCCSIEDDSGENSHEGGVGTELAAWEPEQYFEVAEVYSIPKGVHRQSYGDWDPSRRRNRCSQKCIRCEPMDS